MPLSDDEEAKEKREDSGKGSSENEETDPTKNKSKDKQKNPDALEDFDSDIESVSEDVQDGESEEANSGKDREFKEYVFKVTDVVKVTDEVDSWKEFPVTTEKEEDLLPGT